MSSSNCCFLTCIQVSQETGERQAGEIPICLRSFQFVVIHTIKGLSLVNEAEVDAFLEFSCFFCDPMDVGNLISGSSAFSKSSLNIWKFLVYILLKPSLENFEHYFASVWDECNCAVVWTFFGIAFLWDWNENWPSCVCFYNLGTSIVLGKNTLLPYSGYTCFRRNWTYLPVLGVGNPALAKESTGSPCFQKLILSLAWIPNQANENQPRCWLAALQKRKSAFL